MVYVPAGNFTMGDRVYMEEAPVENVHVDAFWIDRHEVTNAQFAEFVAATGYVTRAERPLDPALYPDLPEELRVPGAVVFVQPQSVVDLADINQWWRFVPGANWRHPGGPQTGIEGREQFPVVALAVEDAQAYAQWKGRQLPTEAQWEWAARGADPNALPSREQPKEANSWQGIFPVANGADDGFVGLAPVGCFAPNPLGLYDMIGNVWEWTSDPYTDRTGRPAAASARNVIKGGSYLCAPNYCMRYRPGARQGQEADLPTGHIGFRTVLPATSADR